MEQLRKCKGAKIIGNKAQRGCQCKKKGYSKNDKSKHHEKKSILQSYKAS